MTKKDKVHKALVEASKISIKKIPTTNGHSIDMNKLDKVPEIAQTISELKALGVDGKWLMDNGFIAAGMLYSQYL